MEDKIQSTPPRSVFAATFSPVGYDYVQWHLNRPGIKGSPMCPLCGDAEGMDLGHIQKCQGYGPPGVGVGERKRYLLPEGYDEYKTSTAHDCVLM